MNWVCAVWTELLNFAGFVWLVGCIFRHSGIVWTGSLGLVSPVCLLFGGGGGGGGGGLFKKSGN